jgi:predicted LPLAT superfamily acyltransferase
MTETESIHWSKQKEKTAGYWHLKFSLYLFRFFPVIILRILAFFVGFFYFIFSKNARDISKKFLEKAALSSKDPKMEKKCLSFFGPLRHIISFSLTLIEKIETWSGKFPFKNIHFQNDDINELVKDMENKKGLFLVTSHLGNVELLRGLVKYNRTGVSREVPITAIIDLKVSKNFTRMLNELNPQSSLDIISAQEIGPDTAVLLEEKLTAGGIVTIAGDRTAADNSEKNLMIPFLGEAASFSPGNLYLAVLLNAPVYFIFALRRGELSVKPQYDMHVHKSVLSCEQNLSKKERLTRCHELIHSYAALLETYCKDHPFQWYNFYDFWSKGV